jgi:hypothetical protein
MQGSTSIPIVMEGREPIGESQTFTLFVEALLLDGTDWELADEAAVQLTVTLS